jgi:hypothetical protein
MSELTPEYELGTCLRCKDEAVSECRPKGAELPPGYQPNSRLISASRTQ